MRDLSSLTSIFYRAYKGGGGGKGWNGKGEKDQVVVLRDMHPTEMHAVVSLMDLIPVIMCCRIHRILLQLSTMASQQSHCILSQAGLHGWLAHIHTSSTPVHTNDCTTALPWGSGGCELSDDAFKYKRMYYLSPTLLIKCHLN